MSAGTVVSLDSPWRRARRRLRPLTSRIPGGHLASAGAMYARGVLPGLPRPAQRFVIFAQGRSGSTLLTDLLNSNPDVRCDDEILTFHHRWPVRYAAAHTVGHRVGAWGFKVKIYQLIDAQRTDPGEFLRRMHREGWLVIYLHRRNVVRQALSASIAKERGGHYHQTAGDRPIGPVVIDAADVVRRVRQREHFGELEAAALSDVPHLALTYEDDLARPEDHQRTADRIFDLAGVARSPVETVLERISSDPLAGVANRDEVRDALAAAGYAHLLEVE
jgi:LPS sulfotransferase NodH